MPGFSGKTFPFVLLRDDYGLKIFNVVTRRLIHLKEALYTSQSGYKTIDLIVQTGSSEFEAIYLETNESDTSPNQTITTFNRMLFNEGFHNLLRQYH